ncbi:hypothetical protein WR164_04020 [Philodulcilactobacillus myokoensis]|uniref:Uncharacterized protein n=1 Tax=Philodulcilactobacillus myokoensis TaxID=2929573 RepID=A0A9W6B110_9LACO|nr:hypothetical protein WR164_04020 [Philodulcilactobacillus myokoensis]
MKKDLKNYLYSIVVYIVIIPILGFVFHLPLTIIENIALLYLIVYTIIYWVVILVKNLKNRG